MIRPFTPEDWPAFISLMHSLHEEGAASTLRFSERAMLQDLKRPGLFNILAEQDGEVVGVCMGWVEQTFFGPDKIAHQHIFYVHPRARGGILGKEMMGAFEKWAAEEGAAEVWVSQATGIETERMERFFGALGFEKVGCIARKSV